MNPPPSGATHEEEFLADSVRIGAFESRSKGTFSLLSIKSYSYFVPGHSPIQAVVGYTVWSGVFMRDAVLAEQAEQLFG